MILRFLHLQAWVSHFLSGNRPAGNFSFFEWIVTDFFKYSHLPEGKIEGIKEAIEIGLELKYGVEGLRLLERIGKIAVIEKLEAIKEAVKISKNMEEIEKLL